MSDGQSLEPQDRVRSPYLKWVVAFVPAAFLAVIWLGVVGRKPDQPRGPYPVRFTELQVPLTRGEAPVETVLVRAGVWLPSKDAEAATRQHSLPLIVYAPGWGEAYDDNAVLVREIASHGFAVIGIDDIARDPKAPWAQADDEHARFASFDVDDDARQVQFLEDAERRVALASRKVRAVIDALQRMQARDKQLAIVDFDRIGALGASFGGATMVETSFDDPRLRAVINLDGLVFGRAAGQPVGVPYMEMNSSLGGVPATAIDDPSPRRRFFARFAIKEIARQQRQLAAAAESYNVTIQGTRHSDFTDQLYANERILAWRPFRDRPLRPARVRAIVDDLTLKFFAAHLTRDIAAHQALRTMTLPDVTIERGAPKS